MMTAWMLALPLAALAYPQPAKPTFFEAVAAYEAGDVNRCADLTLAIESAGSNLPVNGEMLAAECLAAAGRVGDALAYVRRQLPGGRIGIDDLRGKSRPGLDAMRRDPAWPAVLAEAERLEADRHAGMDLPLRAELMARADRDQQARTAVLGKPGTTIDAKAWAPIAAVDGDNLIWLKQVIEQHGWPGSRLVGRDGANAAWLLVQHADADPAFQRTSLALMQRASDPGDIDQANVALLTDRVLLAEGKPQRYGTQFQTGDDGVSRMRPVEDPAGLDSRRAAAGLPSMDEYKAMLSEMYGAPAE